MPKKSHCKLLLIIALLWIPFLASAQSDSSFLTHAVNKLTQQPATEKVYLHLDKPGGYFFGDTIWYKAYTVIGQHHQLSALSGVLYVELINPKDSVLIRQTLHLVSGVAWGDIPLPRALKQGSYRIRAYTNWMRNFDPAYFYDQRIRVGGIAPTLAKQETPKAPDVQFFPEGGQLVDGVRSRVAVKAIAANGLGEDIKGTIEDNEGNVVADFATQHLGMGVFALIPQAGKTYKAKINIPGETAFTVNLPKAQAEGFTIALNNSQKDSIYIKVAVNEKVLNEQKNSTFYIIAQSNGKVYYTAQGKLESLVYSAKVEKKRFPTGISKFTLFSQSGEPLAERIAFIKGNDTLKISANAISPTYTTRQKVKIDLHAEDNTKQPATGSFSVAVIDESRAGADENTESTIENNLLLTSDLKGYIEQPNYYFTNGNTDQKQADLDILMLTQGYRRFEWKQVLNNIIPTLVYQPERELEIEGALKTPSGKTVPNGKITLLATKEKFISDTTTDAEGNFKFANLGLPDTAKIILRARKEHNGSNVAIYVKQHDFPAVSKTKEADPNARIVLPEAMDTTQIKAYAEYQKQLIEDSVKNARQLEGVIIKGKRVAKADLYNRYGSKEEKLLDLKKLKGYPSLAVALDHNEPQLVNSHILIDAHYLDKVDSIPVILDGIAAYKKDLAMYSPDEVESVGVVYGIIPEDMPLVVVTTKRFAGTDTTVLKGVNIKAKKTPKADVSNMYGTDAPYTISGAKLVKYGDLMQALQATLPNVFYRDGKFMTAKRPPGPLYIVINGRLTNTAELNNYSTDEIESAKILEGGGYKTLYGIMGSGVGRNQDPPILLITTKQYAGTDTVKAIGLKQVDIKSVKAKKEPVLTHSDNLNGPGKANQVIMGETLQGCITLSDCLQGKVFGVIFKNGVPFLLRGQSRLGNVPGMAIIVDGVFGASLNDLNANEIYSIEVLRSGAYLAIYGSNAPGGALVITTRRGGENTTESDYVTSETPAGLITYPFKGYTKAKVFYSPKYTHAKTDTELADLRSTIYWNPNILTDKDGKASFEYFNNDTKGTYRIVFEGIDDNGNLGRQEYRYKVE